MLDVPRVRRAAGLDDQQMGLLAGLRPRAVLDPARHEDELAFPDADGASLKRISMEPLMT